jgi:hypothetical protein
MANLAHEADIHDNGPNIRSGSNFLVQATATAGQKQTCSRFQPKSKVGHL